MRLFSVATLRKLSYNKYLLITFLSPIRPGSVEKPGGHSADQQEGETQARLSPREILLIVGRLQASDFLIIVSTKA